MQNSTCFLLLDASRMDVEIISAKELNPEFNSLYRGNSETSLSAVAPYLFSFNPQTEFGEWYLKKGWGDCWGVLVYSSEEMKALIKHFRNFLLVNTEDRNELYFRFYDPRVLRIFLPTCDKEQLKEFFGPVDYFICEDEDSNFGLVFSLTNGTLDTSRITKDQVIAFEPEQKKRKFLFF
jgi:hypothetical protein